MLDEKDLQAIAQLIGASEQRMTTRMEEMIGASEERMTARMEEMVSTSERRMQVLIENEVSPKFNLLADAIGEIREMLVPRSRVDDLEDEVKFLKIMVRQMAERVSQLEKAN